MALYKSVVYVKPVFVALIAFISFVLFPDGSYYPATYALLAALGLDILSKYFAVSIKNGGLKKAIKTKKLTLRVDVEWDKEETRECGSHLSPLWFVLSNFEFHNDCIVFSNCLFCHRVYS